MWLRMPTARRTQARCGEVPVEGAGCRSEPVRHGAVGVAPEDIVDVIAIEVADRRDLPVHWQADVRAWIRRETSRQRAEPLGDGAGAVTPQDVVAPVAVEVAGTDDLPSRGEAGIRVGKVARKPAIRIAKPIGNSAAAIAPQNVVDVIAVEVTDAGDVPVGRQIGVGVHKVGGEPSAGCAQPVRDAPVSVAP